MNLKIMSKLIESEREGRFAGAEILTANDGETAIEILKEEMSVGRTVHFVLIDYIMVDLTQTHLLRIFRKYPLLFLILFSCVCMDLRPSRSYDKNCCFPELLSVRLIAKHNIYIIRSTSKVNNCYNTCTIAKKKYNNRLSNLIVILLFIICKVTN